MNDRLAELMNESTHRAQVPQPTIRYLLAEGARRE